MGHWWHHFCPIFGPSIISASFAICTSWSFFTVRKLLYFVNYVNLVRTGSRKPELWATLSRQTFNLNLSWARQARSQTWQMSSLPFTTKKWWVKTVDKFSIFPPLWVPANYSSQIISQLCESHEISDCHQLNYF